MIDKGNTASKGVILIVDDDIDFAESLADILTLENYEVRVEREAANVLSVLSTYPAECAFVDIRIGHASGIDLIGEIRAKHPIHCIVMTAYAEVDSAIEAIKSGASDYLRKPIHPTDLFYALSRCYEMINIEKQKAEALLALQESEDRFVLAVEGANSGIWDWDVLKNTFVVSERWRRMFGEPPSADGDILASWVERIYPDDQAVFSRALSEHLNGTAREFEHEHRMRCLQSFAESGHVWILERAVVLRGADGKPTRIVGASLDIDERKALEDQLLQSQKMQAIGELAGGVAHDFNNLLTGILGYAALLKLDFPDEPQIQKAASVIEQAGVRAMDLTSQLLGFARKGKNRNVQVDLKEIILEVVRLLERTFDKGIELKPIFLTDGLFTSGDPTQIQQVFLNLAINARDALRSSQAGSIRFVCERVRIAEPQVFHNASIERGEYVRIDVADNGVGIPQENIQRIFEPFFTTKEVGEGVGMGLPMVYGIATNHGGAVEVTSQMGTGTVFSVYLPVYQVHESVTLSDNMLKTTAPQPVKEPEEADFLVMVVDDEPLLLQVATDMLERLGCKVVSFGVPAEAIDFYKAHSSEVTIVILDLIMPQMNGREVYSELKKINPSVSVILSTGFGFNEQAQMALNEGVISFVKKPYSFDELATKIIEVSSKCHLKSSGSLRR